ncbi:unnamed protein product [Spirodela intermedia]|uniref:Uncharacterized protein n=1 Tax=Spirodela intermedia TaxID=51605 RepID=A0A7I8IUV2_SPIIN|nr:unnamed protein product [Spirodela intermedia]CAA6661598.1 unnamed protein product [Spirodela intermedia]
MLRPQIHSTPNVGSSHSQLFGYRAVLVPGYGKANVLAGRVPGRPWRGRKKAGRISCSAEDVLTETTKPDHGPVKVKCVLTVKPTVGGVLSNFGISRGLDEITDLLGRSIFLDLVSTDLDPETGLEKSTVQAFVHKSSLKDGKQRYEGEFLVPKGFGEIGAVLVTNEHHQEMFFDEIVLSGYGDSKVVVSCNSWVHTKFENPEKRIFFVDKAYLPSQTPGGLHTLREKELDIQRGDGRGERKIFERIYDYDTYNDLGDPDKSDDLARPVLGGQRHPYPRRCRTGRPRTKKDPQSEKRASDNYVPRDESFSEVKAVTFSVKTVRSVLHALIPTLENIITDPKLGFPHFTAIDNLFDDGIELPPAEKKGFLQTALPSLVKAISEGTDDVLLFDPPAMIEKDKFSWFRDEEFARQTLAGLNPFSIELVKEFPFVSKLDPQIYGPPESAITKEIIEREIKGIMTVEEAIEKKKLFIIDYHDLFLPYVHKVRQLEGTTLYGSRTVFFLTEDGTLSPIAIELTRPASPTAPQWKEVFTHTSDATGAWLWRLAKAHVCAHDAGYHQLVEDACLHRALHHRDQQAAQRYAPDKQATPPHFRYTMEINALAREALINAEGTIETCFSPGKYSMEISSVAYDKLWRFDEQALPADLIKRGMAVEDPTAFFGLRLTIEDYPFAADGLLIWTAIKQWVEDYVGHYYPGPSVVTSDTELQEWWEEIRNKGHADKRKEPWWPALNTPEDLYYYAGYFPNRPTIVRSRMPVEDGNERDLKRFWEKPERTLMENFPTQIQATRVMAVLDVLSAHSIDEEYIGDLPLREVRGTLTEIEGIIDERNQDRNLKNRCGAGVVPYELLKPFSKPGVTGMGVPNSISI